MLEHYAPENISVLGTSSGGNLALGMVSYINETAPDTPIPGYIMAISPGTCVSTEEWQRMLALDKKDVAILALDMKTAVQIMRHGDDTVPDYMIWLKNVNRKEDILRHLIGTSFSGKPAQGQALRLLEAMRYPLDQGNI